MDKKIETELYRRMKTILECAAAPGKSEEYRMHIDLVEQDLIGLAILNNDYYALKLNLMLDILRRTKECRT